MNQAKTARTAASIPPSPEPTPSIDSMLDQREARYGDFRDHSVITQNIKRAMQAAPKYQNLEDWKKESLEMIAHKIGRILNGDSDYKDSWTDIIGYTRLIEQDLGE